MTMGRKFRVGAALLTDLRQMIWSDLLCATSGFVSFGYILKPLRAMFLQLGQVRTTVWGPYCAQRHNIWHILHILHN